MSKEEAVERALRDCITAVATLTRFIALRFLVQGAMDPELAEALNCLENAANYLGPPEGPHDRSTSRH